MECAQSAETPGSDTSLLLVPASSDCVQTQAVKGDASKEDCETNADFLRNEGEAQTNTAERALTYDRMKR
jgi:hypothetical protein